jgi:hypothetical protein
LNQRSVFVNSGAVPSFGRPPFASAWTPAGTGSVNFGLRSLISCRRFATASDRSSDAVALTSGIFRATSWSKLTSTFVTMRSAVASITAPMTRWTSGPRPAARTRSSTRRPPRQSASSTAAEPIAYATATATDRPVAALTVITAARIGPAHGV